MGWQAYVSYTVEAPYTEDAVFDLIGQLAEFAAVGEISRDLMSGGVTLTVDAPTTIDAVAKATQIVTNAARTTVGEPHITGIDVKSEEAVEQELAQPLYPEVVGYAEIADMAHVSRQAARGWAENPSFPRPVIETAQGPLRSKAAVENWLNHRITRRSTSAHA